MYNHKIVRFIEAFVEKIEILFVQCLHFPSTCDIHTLNEQNMPHVSSLWQPEMDLHWASLDTPSYMTQR